MDLQRKIDSELTKQKAPYADDTDATSSDKVALIAQGYAEIENLLVVLSDLRRRESHIFHSRFSDSLELKHLCQKENISSIWEQNILETIFPTDLESKFLNELLFLQFLKTQPKSKRFDYYLSQKLRMRDKTGAYIDALHRQYYLPNDRRDSTRYELCLYGPLNVVTDYRAWLTDMTNGHQINIDLSSGKKILSRQETEVLKLIELGRKSKEIAELLNISVHTVSRHRQNIIDKLQVRNSVEACRIARRLGIFQ